MHCIVWAKFIYATLFGPRDDANILSDLKIDIDASDNRTYAQRVFTQFFETEVIMTPYRAVYVRTCLFPC